MKKLRLLISLCVALFSVACSYNELPENLKTTTTFEDKIALNVETRAETYEGQALDQEYFVTATDLENFVNFRRKESDRSNLSVREVKSYGFDSSQTLFYILNYDKGWEVVAADKRVQPTLAHGDDGTFTMDTDNEPMKFWMNMLADGVLKTRQTSDIATRTSADNAEEETTDVNQHLKFWETISPSKDSTRGGLTPIWGPLTPIDSIGIGIRKKYYLPHVMDSYSESTYYGPYIETSWGQESPWNVCCPTINNTRCLAGCTPVSCGQMLYFLVNRYDLDIITYEDIECTILENGEYVFDKYNPSTTLWENMATWDSDATHNTQYVSALLVHLGDLLGTTYGITSSSTPCEAEKEYVFDYYNFNCTYLNAYSSSTVKSQIKDRSMPVMVRGENSEGGHSWIIDGCCDFRNIIKKYYIYSSMDLTDSDLLAYTKEDADGYDTITYSSLGMIHMNWGWGGTANGWYSDVYSAPSNRPDDPYDENVEIMYGFIPN